jgi:hypothetical protein
MWDATANTVSVNITWANFMALLALAHEFGSVLLREELLDAMTSFPTHQALGLLEETFATCNIPLAYLASTWLAEASNHAELEQMNHAPTSKFWETCVQLGALAAPPSVIIRYVMPNSSPGNDPEGKYINAVIGQITTANFAEKRKILHAMGEIQSLACGLLPDFAKKACKMLVTRS